jgi:hypothetical protein
MEPLPKQALDLKAKIIGLKANILKVRTHPPEIGPRGGGGGGGEEEPPGVLLNPRDPLRGRGGRGDVE